MSDYKLMQAEPTQEQIDAFIAMWSPGFCDERMARVCYEAFRAAAPAVQHPFEWPKLDRPAKVGAARFGKGVSSRLVVEAAQRQYDYDVTPEKEAERIAKFADFRKEVLQPMLVAAGLVEALESVVAYDESVEDTDANLMIHYADMMKKVRAALDAHRKLGAQQ